jgi:hypothetical protein
MARFNRASGIVADGLQRLLHSPEFRDKKEAIKAQVRSEYAAELSSTSDYWKRLGIEDRIDREIARRIESITPSRYALWSSR